MDFLAGVVAMVLLVVPLWRIFRRAGLAPALSLLAVIPVLGLLIAAAILAYADWPAARDRASV